jgi:hypothetical protein
MNHPELLLIPALMLSDYLLTVAGARQRERGYADHFKTQHYELNPIWQQAIARKQWFNPRHLALVLLVGVVLVVADAYLIGADDPQIAFFTGAMLVVLGAINGRHLGNLATFAYIRRHPTELSGTIALSHELVLWLSTFQFLALLLPLALLAIYTPQPGVLGGFAGAAILLLVNLIWILRWRRRRRPEPESA